MINKINKWVPITERLPIINEDEIGFNYYTVTRKINGQMIIDTVIFTLSDNIPLWEDSKSDQPLNDVVAWLDEEELLPYYE